MTVKYINSLALNLLPGRREIKSINIENIEMPRIISNTAGIVKKTTIFNSPGTSPFWRVSIKKFLEKRTVRIQRRE